MCLYCLRFKKYKTISFLRKKIAIQIKVIIKKFVFMLHTKGDLYFNASFMQFCESEIFLYYMDKMYV